MELSTTISIIASLVIGIVIGRYLLQKLLKNQEKEAHDKANTIIKEAEERAEHNKKEGCWKQKNASCN